MVSNSSRLATAGWLVLSASPLGPAYARSPTSGTTITLRRQWAGPPSQIVCTGACTRGTNLDVTVWKDGRITFNANRTRVSVEEAAGFSKILLPFRPVGKDATADPSKLSADFCPVKVQWPADGRGSRRVICGTYNEARDSLFKAVMEALRTVHLNIATPQTF